MLVPDNNAKFCPVYIMLPMKELNEFLFNHKTLKKANKTDTLVSISMLLIIMYLLA